MRKLKVDLAELEAALENDFPEHRYFLDLETGKVVSITDDTSRELEDLYAELPEEADVAEAIRPRDLQDWEGRPTPRRSGGNRLRHALYSHRIA